MSKLLYTLGRDDIYIPYMKTKNPKKGVGGSVWKTYDAVKEYINKHHLKGYQVYGVIARWDIDTRLDPKGNGWHELLINAPLKTLNFRNV
jgi:hypothetical protein